MRSVKVGLVADLFAFLMGEVLNTDDKWLVPVHQVLNRFYVTEAMPTIGNSTVRNDIIRLCKSIN